MSKVYVQIKDRREKAILAQKQRVPKQLLNKKAAMPYRIAAFN